MDFLTVGFDEKFQKTIEKMAETGEVYLIVKEYSGNGHYQTIERELFSSIEDVKNEINRAKADCACMGKWAYMHEHWSENNLEVNAEPELIYEKFYKRHGEGDDLVETAYVIRLR